MEEGMIRMDEFNKIRKAYFIDKLSINEIADKFNRSWATVHKIINTPREDEFFSGERKLSRMPKVATQEVMDAIADRIREEQLLKVKKKQRVCATVIFEELTRKGIYQGSQRRMQELVKITRQKHGCPVFEDTQHANAYLEDRCRQAFANDVHSKLQVPIGPL